MRLVTAIDTSFKANGGTYGACPVWHHVLKEGLLYRLHHFERLMRPNAMKARTKRRGNPWDDGEKRLCFVLLIEDSPHCLHN